MVSIRNCARRAVTLFLAGLLLLLSASCGTSEPPTPTVVPSTQAVSPAPVPTSPPPTPRPTVAPSPTPEPENSLVPRLAAIPNTSEQRLATDLLDDQIGVYGFIAVEADGTIVASYNSELPFITASTYKLIVMADIYRRVELGELALDQYIELDANVFFEAFDNYFTHGDIGSSFTIQEYIFAMGAYSSNVGARTLMTLTSPEALRETALAIGMEDTHLFVDLADLPNWPPSPGVDGSVEDLNLAQTYLEQSMLDSGSVNITTPLDMARYQLAILHDTLVSPWVSAQVAGVLQKNVIRDRIPYFFDHILVLNKPGDLPDATNDAGLLFLADGPRAVVTFAQALPDPDHAVLVEQRLALIGAGVEDIPPLYYGSVPVMIQAVVPVDGGRHAGRASRRSAGGGHGCRQPRGRVPGARCRNVVREEAGEGQTPVTPM
jgi:beta-lactamase class A